MIRFLLSIIGFKPTKAHAESSLDSIGSGAGVEAMWSQIRSIFPWTDTGGGGVAIILSKIMTFVLGVIASAAVAVLIYAAILMVMSAGDESKLEEAKKTATYALLGIVFAGIGEAVVMYTANLVGLAIGG